MRTKTNLQKSSLFLRKTKALPAALACLSVLLFFTGCGGGGADTLPDSDQKIRIVCTAFPQYDWMREIIGDPAENLELTFLFDNGADPHSFQPAAKDIASISSADIFVYTGGESDQWVEDILREPVNTDMCVINLLEVLDDAAKEEETVEGMQEGRHREEDAEYDEHVWLSLKNAEFFVRTLSDEIGRADPENAGKYAENADLYIQKLKRLDKQYEQAILSSRFDTVLFGDRFPFRYLMDDYGLRYYAAFPGCSAETEAGFGTITFLSGKMDELELGSILILENSDPRIAETIKQNTRSGNQDILVLNSIQSVTKSDVENGYTYLNIMQDNLEILKQALN